jgi:hypothetical protein
MKLSDFYRVLENQQSLVRRTQSAHMQGRLSDVFIDTLYQWNGYNK